MTLTPDIIDADHIGACDYCGKVDVLTTWFPERYAAVNYSPNSFSADELEDVCARCVERYRVTHDPAIKRRPRPPWLKY